MLWNQISFLKSASQIQECPSPHLPEIAFVGRSNSGKSSAINAITRIKHLARASKTPGRTQLINYFVLNEIAYLVDLPGYGFANVSADQQRIWEKNVTQYLMERENLLGLILVMDIRHPFKPTDELMLSLAQSRGFKIHVLLTKADKLSTQQVKRALVEIKQTIGEQDYFTLQAFSALKGTGLDEARNTMEKWLKLV